MTVAGFVLVCALDLLGRSTSQFPPIVVLDERPADASPQAAAFVRRGEHVIYMIASAPVFRAAVDRNRHMTTCSGVDGLRLLASVIVHEEWHLLHGSDEQGAYYAQLTELQRLGDGPGRWAYESVRRAMVSTVGRDAGRMRSAGQLAARATPVPAAVTPSARPPSDPLWPRVAQELMRLPALPR